MIPLSWSHLSWRSAGGQDKVSSGLPCPHLLKVPSLSPRALGSLISCSILGQLPSAAALWRAGSQLPRPSRHPFFPPPRPESEIGMGGTGPDGALRDGWADPLSGNPKPGSCLLLPSVMLGAPTRRWPEGQLSSTIWQPRLSWHLPRGPCARQSPPPADPCPLYGSHCPPLPSTATVSGRDRRCLLSWGHYELGQAKGP